MSTGRENGKHTTAYECLGSSRIWLEPARGCVGWVWGGCEWVTYILLLYYCCHCCKYIVRA